MRQLIDPQVRDSAVQNRMGRLSILCGLLLAVTSAGCPQYQSGPFSVIPCNGTDETVVYEFPGSSLEFPFDNTVEVAPCSCGTQFTGFFFETNDNRGDIFVRDIDGDLLASSPVFLSRDPDMGGYFLAFNGVDPFPPQFAQPHLVQLCNESDRAVHIVDDVLDPPGLTERTLIQPGECRCWFAPAGKVVFQVFAADAVGTDQPLGVSQPFIPSDDVASVAWDGEQVRVGDSPPPPPPPPPADADIELCNIGPFSVHIVLLNEPFSDDTLLKSGACRLVTVATGAEAFVTVFDSSGREFLGGCGIQDPSTGDTVVWDGQSAECIDAPAAESHSIERDGTSPLEPVPDPVPSFEARPRDLLIELLREYSGLSNDAKAAVREVAKTVLESAVPIGGGDKSNDPGDKRKDNPNDPRDKRNNSLGGKLSNAGADKKPGR